MNNPNVENVPQLLGKAGPLLYDTTWRTDLAAALGVTPRTLRNWLAGETLPQFDIRSQLQGLYPQQVDAKLRKVEGEMRELESLLGIEATDEVTG